MALVSVGKEYRQTLFSAQYVKNGFINGAVVCVNQKWMDEVPRASAISDIQSSPIGDERSSVCQLCQKQHDLWK